MSQCSGCIKSFETRDLPTSRTLDGGREAWAKALNRKGYLMCQFFSALYTRTGDLLWHWCTDHHSDLMRIFKLKDEQEQHFVRVEFTPPEDLATIVDVDTWKFRLDEERTPGWFDAEAKAAAIAKLKGVVSSHIVTDARDVLTDGPWVLADGANVNTILSGRIALMCASSNVGVMRGSSNVGEMWESSKVGEMRGVVERRRDAGVVEGGNG